MSKPSLKLARRESFRMFPPGPWRSSVTPWRKSGRRAEAQAELDGLLKLSKERYVSPYNIALIYNALGVCDETIEWLEATARKNRGWCS